MANDLIPYKRPGEDVTGEATAAITGKRCVQITAAKTSPSEGLSDTADGNLYMVGHPNASGAAGAAVRVFGVAKYDAALGGRVGIVRGGIVPIETAAAVSAGDEVEVAAAGTVTPVVAGVAIGMVLNDAGLGDDAEVALY